MELTKEQKDLLGKLSRGTKRLLHEVWQETYYQVTGRLVMTFVVRELEEKRRRLQGELQSLNIIPTAPFALMLGLLEYVPETFLAHYATMPKEKETQEVIVLCKATRFFRKKWEEEKRNRRC